MGWNLRVRHTNGQSTVSGLEPSSSLNSLQLRLAELCGTPVEQQELLLGFPPKPLQVPNNPLEATLSSVGILNGDTIVVRESSTAAPAAPSPPLQSGAASNNPSQERLQRELQAALAAAMRPEVARPEAVRPAPLAAVPVTSSSQNDRATPPAPNHGQAAAAQRPAPSQVVLVDGSCVVRRLIDSDNSCLFNAVGYVMEHDRTKARELRSLIAGVVSSDPETYNEAFLGKSNEEYCQWIQQVDKWGGAIELAILSQHYNREIAAYDIQTKRCDLYGQDAGHTERAMLIYDGLHYDALAVSAFEGAPEELDITMFAAPSSEAEMYDAGAKKLVEAAHQARQFTDTATFTLRCGTCQIGLKGEKEAVEHAKSTGHSNFSEY